MHATIVMESPHSVFTNLDFVRGKVVLYLNSMTAIQSIVVKLEGETRTRLTQVVPPEYQNRPNLRDELHKVLYRTETLLAPSQGNAMIASQSHYVLQPGQYEYPFSFKIPFNNACWDAPPTTNVNIAGLRLEVAKPSLQHIKATLPPTVTAFPGVAGIRYYVKVTVNRKEFFKENIRVLQDFNFVPIEPPMPPPTSSESYARRQHLFNYNASDSKMKGLFGSVKRAPGQAVRSDSGLPPMISLDGRLPNPAVVRCNQELPLRLIVKRLNESPEWLYLQSLHIELLGHTRIRAVDIYRTETSRWLIASHANMNILLDDGTRHSKEDSKASASDDIVIDSGAWRGRLLPNSIAPSFETCNISRRYEIIIKVGLGYGPLSTKNMVVLPLTMPVSVYSGIKPPAALLAAINQSGGPKPVTKKPLSQQAQHNLAAAQAAQPGPSNGRPPQPPRPQFAPLPPGEEEPPPSYEDAMAEDIGPVDGPRDYQPPPITGTDGGFPQGKSRRDS